MNLKYITSKRIFGTFGTLLTLYQANSIYNYGKFYDKAMFYRFRKEKIKKEELYELDKLIGKIGIFPFSLISSLYYGTNRIEFFPLRISYDKDFFDDVKEFYNNNIHIPKTSI